MKRSMLKVLGLAALLSTSISTVTAGSNNGYTTAGNVYSGSSSRGWYGGGVEHTLAQWRMKDAPVAKEEVAVEAEGGEGAVESVENDSTVVDPESKAVPAADTAVDQEPAPAADGEDQAEAEATPSTEEPVEASTDTMPAAE